MVRGLTIGDYVCECGLRRESEPLYRVMSIDDSSVVIRDANGDTYRCSLNDLDFISSAEDWRGGIIRLF